MQRESILKTAYCFPVHVYIGKSSQSRTFISTNE